MEIQKLRSKLGMTALAAAVVLGAAPLVKADTRSERAAARAAAAADDQKKINYDDLPAKVRETIDKEKGRDTVRSVYEVKRGDKMSYSVVLGAKNGDEKTLRVSPSGELLSAVDEGTGTTPRVRIPGGAGADEQKPVKLGDVPEKVRKTIEKEKGKDSVKSIYEVKRNGRQFYSVVLAGRGTDEKIVRVGPEGELLSAVDEGTAAAEPRVRPNEARPAAASGDIGTNVNYDDLPGGVKSTIGREAGSYTQRKGVTEYQHRGQTVYRAVMSDGNRDKIVRVFADGKVFSNEDATPAGAKEVKFDAFPYAPKVAVTKEAGAGQVTRAWQFTQDGKTHYRVMLDDGRTFDTTDDGTIVKSEPNDPGRATPGRRRG